jgi:hypothetical protein
MAKYEDPVLKAVIDLLNATGPQRLKNRYFQGDPVIIPTAYQYPLCFVSRDTTTMSIDSTNYDMEEMPIVLNVVVNGARELNQTNFAQAGALDLYDLVEGRTDTYDLRADTIAGVLRGQQVIDGNNRLFLDVTGSNLAIEYALSSPERRQIWSVEAVIRTTVKHLGLRQ